MFSLPVLSAVTQMRVSCCFSVASKGETMARTSIVVDNSNTSSGVVWINRILVQVGENTNANIQESQVLKGYY